MGLQGLQKRKEEDIAMSVLGSLKKVINKTTTEIINSDITKKTGEVVNTFINTCIEVVDDILKEVKEFTKEKTS